VVGGSWRVGLIWKFVGFEEAVGRLSHGRNVREGAGVRNMVGLYGVIRLKVNM
jgi:hypothetical protein